MDYISREELRQAMYHEAFETDTNLQKWDGGCWIRYKLFENVIEHLPAADVVERKWINVKECLPNEDEMFYNGVSVPGERELSDRVLALDKDGYIRCGYFMGSCNYHEYNGHGRVTNKYTRAGQAGWEFGNRHNDDPQGWVVGTTLDIRYWMPLPEPYKGV